MKKQNMTIAILASTVALGSAMQAGLEKRYPDATFEKITKLSDRPEGAVVASLGLPSFVPGQDGIKVLSFGSKIIEGATPSQRSSQWTTLRDPSATVEEVMAELGNWSEYTILQGKSLAEAKEATVDVKIAVSEAKEIEDKDEALKAELAAYKLGFQALAAMLG